MNPHLSKREEEVLHLILKGHMLQEIADQLFVTVKHVQGLKARIRRKWSVKSDIEIAFEAMRRGYISMPTPEDLPQNHHFEPANYTYTYIYKESSSKTIKITIDE